MINLSFDDVNIYEDSVPISGASFGAKYTAFRPFDRFVEQTSDIDLGLIHWPGGSLAELDDGRFGFEFSGLFNPDVGSGRPTLTEIFTYARDNMLDVAITLPTARYQDDPSQLASEATGFFEELFSGAFGPLPDTLIIELGNEFYGAFEGATEAEQAADYAQVVNAYAEIIQSTEQQFDVGPDQIEYAVQLARTEAGEEALLENLSDVALLNTDYLAHHRYPFQPSGADKRIDDIRDALDDFGEATEAAGGEAPGLFVSEYNTAILSRIEIARDYLALPENAAQSLDDLDLKGRTNFGFEEYYQNQLGKAAYGASQAENILQIFSEYQGVGADAMTSWGWDSVHAGRLTFETEGEAPVTLIGGALHDMMAEALPGTRVLDLFEDNRFGPNAADDIATFGFSNDDKLILFLTAPDTLDTPLDVMLDFEGLGPVVSVWGESLTAETPENWNELFDIPQTPGVDQRNEAETFAVAERELSEVEVSGNQLQIAFTEPGEVIRLSFARTADGVGEISEWHSGDAIEITGYADAPLDIPVIEVPEDDSGDPVQAAESTGGSSSDGGGGAEGILIALILPILLALGGG